MGGGGGGGDSSMKCPDVCVGGLNMYQFIKDALGKKNIPILHNSYPYYGVIHVSGA